MTVAIHLREDHRSQYLGFIISQVHSSLSRKRLQAFPEPVVDYRASLMWVVAFTADRA
jgi:hypothetical protein